jgi:hypothetical protein
LSRLQEALGLQGRITAYALFLKNPEQAARLEGELQRHFGARARVSTYARLNAPLFLALSLEKWHFQRLQAMSTYEKNSHRIDTCGFPSSHWDGSCISGSGRECFAISVID